eukprot:673314-Rhodomonas_salina.1
MKVSNTVSWRRFPRNQSQLSRLWIACGLICCRAGVQRTPASTCFRHCHPWVQRTGWVRLGTQLRPAQGAARAQT